MDRYKNIFDTIREIKPKSIMEIGVWNGVHAEAMIKLAQKVSNTKQISYTGFDLFEDFTEHEKEFCPKTPANFRFVFTKLNATGCNLDLIRGNTIKTIPEYKDLIFDFIFIDGGHSLETINSDWNNVQRFIGLNTVILLDDFYIIRNDVGCKNLVDGLMFDPKWMVEPLEPIDENMDGTQMIKVQLNQ